VQSQPALKLAPEALSHMLEECRKALPPDDAATMKIIASRMNTEYHEAYVVFHSPQAFDSVKILIVWDLNGKVVKDRFVIK
jgi:hypothetical protein